MCAGKWLKMLVTEYTTPFLTSEMITSRKMYIMFVTGVGSGKASCCV
jgi:hypothetical protein